MDENYLKERAIVEMVIFDTTYSPVCFSLFSEKLSSAGWSKVGSIGASRVMMTLTLATTTTRTRTSEVSTTGFGVVSAGLRLATPGRLLFLGLESG